jgi:Fe-S cluster biosynthesis and repair protein YggX
MDIPARIAQFENMAQADPDNEMAHYSLGSAYMQAGRWADAAGSFLRCAAVAPHMSKAYQLAGEAYLKVGRKDDAAEAFTKGYTVAAERGDLMPKNAMAEGLRALGKPLPAVAGKSGAEPGIDLLGRAQRGGPPPAGGKLDRPPFRGPLGQWIFENIDKARWHSWIGQGTKVINELKLDLSREQDSEVYDQHMREYLGIDDALYERIVGGLH